MISKVSVALLALAVALAVAGAKAPEAPAASIGALVEATGQDCPPVSAAGTPELPLDSTVTGGCVAHVVSTEGPVRFAQAVFGVPVLQFECDAEFAARIGGDAEGYFTDIELSGSECLRRECGTAAGAPKAWKVSLLEPAAGTTDMELHFCYESVGGSSEYTCRITFPVRSDPSGSHAYEFGTVTNSGAETVDAVPCDAHAGGAPGIVAGHWKTELGSLEFAHRP